MTLSDVNIDALRDNFFAKLVLSSSGDSGLFGNACCKLMDRILRRIGSALVELEVVDLVLDALCAGVGVEDLCCKAGLGCNRFTLAMRNTC